MGFGRDVFHRPPLVAPTLFGVTLISFTPVYLLPRNPAPLKAVSSPRRAGPPPPLGRIAAAVRPPTRLTGLYVIDAALTGHGTALLSALHHLMLPALTLGFAVMAPLTRMVRATMLEILESDYVKAAWAAGLPRRRVIYGDALRNALIPVITLLGVIFGFLMAGHVVGEKVFAWPRLGHHAVTSPVTQDAGPIPSIRLFDADIYGPVHRTVDLLYGLADPRIRLR